MTMANNFSFEPMNIKLLRIIEKWKYNEYFPDFDLSAYYKSNENGMIILVGPAGCEGFAVKEGEELIGLFEYYPDIDGKPAIGLALHPELIYKGLGTDVMNAIIHFLLNQKKYSDRFMYLTVAVNNIPAIKFYKKFGFEKYRNVEDKKGEITDLKMRYELF